MTDPLEFCILTFVGDFQKEMITNVINRGVAQVVERYFREVEAASSSLVTPMQSLHEDAGFFIMIGNFISYRMKKDMDAHSRGQSKIAGQMLPDGNRVWRESGPWCTLFIREEIRFFTVQEKQYTNSVLGRFF